MGPWVLWYHSLGEEMSCAHMFHSSRGVGAHISCATEMWWRAEQFGKGADYTTWRLHTKHVWAHSLSYRQTRRTLHPYTNIDKRCAQDGMTHSRVRPPNSASCALHAACRDSFCAVEGDKIRAPSCKCSIQLSNGCRRRRTHSVCKV